MGNLSANGKTPKDIRYGSKLVNYVYCGSELVWSRSALPVNLPYVGTIYGNGVVKWVPEVNRFIYFVHTNNSQLYLEGHQSADGSTWRCFHRGTGIPSAYTVYSFSYWYDYTNEEHMFRVKSTTATQPYQDIVYNPGVWL